MHTHTLVVIPRCKCRQSTLPCGGGVRIISPLVTGFLGQDGMKIQGVAGDDKGEEAVWHEGEPEGCDQSDSS